MSRHTSWRVGGPADRFYEPADIDDLAAFLKTLPAGGPLYWVGLGSNLLVRDGGALLAAAPPFKGPVFLEPDTCKAVELALSLSGKGKKKGTCPLGACPHWPVVIAGSLFLIGEVKRLRLFA